VTDSADEGLGSLWRAAGERLPDGWRLDSLQCASSGLGIHQRSDDWIAVGMNPDGREVRAQGATMNDAIDELVALAKAGLSPS
jgi:hypothetical protein